MTLYLEGTVPSNRETPTVKADVTWTVVPKPRLRLRWF